MPLPNAWKPGSAGFEESAYAQLRRLYLQPRRTAHAQHFSLTDVRGQIAWAGGEIVIPEGTYFAYQRLDFTAANLLVRGAGRKTVIMCIGDAYILWAGADGEMRDLVVKWNAGGGTRTSPAYLVHVTGAKWHGERLLLSDCRAALRMDGAYDSIVFSETRNVVVGQVGIFGNGLYQNIVGNIVAATGIANDINSLGAKATVTHNRVIGGGIFVGGAGSINTLNQV